MSRTALYRFFDDEGDLLYVGISTDPFKRWKQHKQTKDWSGDVASTTITWHDDRAAALADERFAIISERPRYNVQHAPPSVGEPVAITPLHDIELEYSCWRCNEPVTPRQKGYLHCDVAEAIHLRRRQLNHVGMNWDQVGGDDMVRSYYQWMPQPDFRMGGNWHPFHDKCRKRPKTPPTIEFAESREIDLEDIRTIGTLIAAGEGMAGLAWFVYTDWMSVIESAITGSRDVSPAYEGVAVERAIDAISANHLSSMRGSK